MGERDAQKSQLIEALLAKEKLRKEIEEGKELHDASATDPADTDASQAAKKSGEKIEKLRARLKERKQVSGSSSLFPSEVLDVSPSSLLPIQAPKVWVTLFAHHPLPSFLPS